MENFSQRRISMIVADDDVAMLSSRLDAHNKLLRRLWVTGDQLLYDANGGDTHIYGHGTLFAEDYRPPEESAPATPTPGRSRTSSGRTRPRSGGTSS